MFKTIRETLWPTIRSEESFPELSRYSGVRMIALGLVILVVTMLAVWLVDWLLDYGVQAAALDIWAAAEAVFAKMRKVEIFLVNAYVHLGLFVLLGVLALAGTVRASNAIYVIAMNARRTTEDYERIRLLAKNCDKQAKLQLWCGIAFLALSFCSEPAEIDIELTVISVVTFFVTFLIPSNYYKWLLAPKVRECEFVHWMLSRASYESFDVDFIRAEVRRFLN